VSEPYSDNATAALGICREPAPQDYQRVADLITANARGPEDRQALLDAILGPHAKQAGDTQ
jgi:hypothetical protein